MIFLFHHCSCVTKSPLQAEKTKLSDLDTEGKGHRVVNHNTLTEGYQLSSIHVVLYMW